MLSIKVFFFSFCFFFLFFLRDFGASATMKVLPYFQSNGWIVKPTISSDRNASIISGAAAIGAKVKILVEQSNEEDLSDVCCQYPDRGFIWNPPVFRGFFSNSYDASLTN